MIKEFRYIIRRIIVGVCIALLLMFIKGNLLMKVDALVYGNSTSGTTLNLGNTLSDVDFTLPSPIFNGLGGGTLTFNIGLQKQGASGTQSTSPVVVPRSIFVSNGVANYPCFTGSYSSQNSTWDGSYISVQCPFDANLNGLVSIHIRFSTSYVSGNESNYLLTIGGPISFQTEANTQVNVDTSSTNSTINSQTQSIINNQNSNTQSVINNQNSNTQSIINNQNSNTDKEIESQKACKYIDKSSVIVEGAYLDSSGTQNTSVSWGITDFIPVVSSTLEKLSTSGNAPSICFYNANKSLISCSQNNNVSSGTVNIPNNSSYFRASINLESNRPSYYLCTNGNQAIANGQQEINNTINNDNVDSANTEASSFFNNFQSNSHGLSGIITAPLRLIESLSSSTCSSLVLPLPFVSQNATLPCMSTVYNQFPTFYSLWQLITTGMIAYYILIKLFGHVKGMQNPDDDRIEVLNL